MTSYYNEIDPYCAAWLQNLMDAGHIAPGDIDTRSIEDVRPDELAGYTQCHFFAGIGVWSLALRAAGWPDSRRAWTGSCPCQPFSAAGKGAGFADERHLWAAWQHLIAQCRPPVIFGEQVAIAIDWVSLVSSDLEGVGYAVGCMPIEASSAGAYHARDRLFFVADTDRDASGAQSNQWSQNRQQAPRWHNSGRCRENACAPAVIVVGSDGTSRPCQPFIQPMADVDPTFVGQLRAYGNAINAKAAQAFIESYCEARGLIDFTTSAKDQGYA